MTRVMIARGGGEARLDRGFDPLPNAVDDQHFLKRNRLRRVLGGVETNPGLPCPWIGVGKAPWVDVGGVRAGGRLPDPAPGPERRGAEPPPVRG